MKPQIMMIYTPEGKLSRFGVCSAFWVIDPYFELIKLGHRIRVVYNNGQSCIFKAK